MIVSSLSHCSECYTIHPPSRHVHFNTISTYHGSTRLQSNYCTKTTSLHRWTDYGCV